MRGWKVISNDRRSVFAENLGLAARRYPVGVEVRPAPEQGPLAVFDGRAKARSFSKAENSVRAGKGLRVSKCEYVLDDGARNCPIWVRDGSLWSTHFMISGERGPYSREPQELPRGTVLASSVTCLE